MVRVPAKVQFTRHQLIRKIWLSGQGAFGYLPTQEQWLIHRFYQPNVDHDAATLAVRQGVVVERDPALPHRAGKAYKALTYVVAALEKQDRAQRGIPSKKTKGSSRNRAVTVRGIARTEPDIDKLARLLLELARTEMEREELDQASPEDGDRA